MRAWKVCLPARAAAGVRSTSGSASAPGLCIPYIAHVTLKLRYAADRLFSCWRRLAKLRNRAELRRNNITTTKIKKDDAEKKTKKKRV